MIPITWLLGVTPITGPLARGSQNRATARQREVVVKSPLVEQFKNGGAPIEVRLLAGSGAFPLATAFWPAIHR